MIKQFINNIKENIIGDVLFILSGAVVGYIIKIIVENITK